MLLLFRFFLKTRSRCQILSSEIPLYSFFKPGVPVDRHVYTSGTVFTGGKTETIYEKPCFYTLFQTARICVTKYKSAG